LWFQKKKFTPSSEREVKKGRQDSPRNGFPSPFFVGISRHQHLQSTTTQSGWSVHLLRGGESSCLATGGFGQSQFAGGREDSEKHANRAKERGDKTKRKFCPKTVAEKKKRNRLPHLLTFDLLFQVMVF
jgi:hypothetical protein